MTEALQPADSVTLTPDAAIRAWGAYELTAIPDRSPRYTLRRVEILETVLATETGTADLFTTDPALVARRMHRGRADSNRTTRAAARMEAALVDFRWWYQIKSNRGEV